MTSPSLSPRQFHSTPVSRTLASWLPCRRRKPPLAHGRQTGLGSCSLVGGASGSPAPPELWGGGEGNREMVTHTGKEKTGK